MPDYAEVAGCSSFKNSNSPTYDSFGAYASTTLVGRPYPKNSYSAPNSVHYNNYLNNAITTNGQHQQQFALNGSSISMSNEVGPMKMNIIENKMEQMLNNLNNPTNAITQSSLSVNQQRHQQQLQHHQQQKSIQMKSNGSKSVPQTPFLSSMRRNRHLFNNNSNNNNNKLSSSLVDGAEQPLFMKSKFDESWSSIPSTTALTDSTTTSNNNSPSHLASSSYHPSPFRSQHHLQASLNQLNNATDGKAGSNLLMGNSYLSSFGKSDKV